MSEGFPVNELVAFLLSEIVRLNVNSELTIKLLREKGLIEEEKSLYEETLKSTIDDMIGKFPFLQPFFQELQVRLSEEKIVEDEAEKLEQKEEK
jgi:hypothetical protein